VQGRSSVLDLGCMAREGLGFWVLVGQRKEVSGSGFWLYGTRRSWVLGSSCAARGGLGFWILVAQREEVLGFWLCGGERLCWVWLYGVKKDLDVEERTHCI